MEYVFSAMILPAIPRHGRIPVAVLVAFAASALSACVDTHHQDNFDDLLNLPPNQAPEPQSTVEHGPTPMATEPVARVCPTEPDGGAVAASLTRSAILALLDRGFGRFLARVQVTPVHAHGRFVGFRLVCATDLAHWQSVGADLRVGDVITRINGRSVEMPDTAFAVFEGLRAAPELTIELLRGDAPITLRQPIADDAAAAPH